MDKAVKLTIPDDEFGYTIELDSEDSKTINWKVYDDNGDLVLTGIFKSDNYYRSTFSFIQDKVDENKYENLFYLYFENIKLKCIELAEIEEE